MHQRDGAFGRDWEMRLEMPWARYSWITYAALSVIIALGIVPCAAQSAAKDGSSPKGSTMEHVATKIAEFHERDDVACVEFSPDEKQLAISTATKNDVHLWAWEGRSHIERTLSNPHGTADMLLSQDCLRYSPDGSLLAAAHAWTAEEGAVRVFSPKTGAIVRDIPDPVGGGLFSRIDFSPDGKRLIRTYDSDERSTGQFHVHRVDTWETLWSLNVLPLNVRTLAVTRDGKRAAISGLMLGPKVRSRAVILIIDLEQRKVIRTLDDVFQADASVDRLAWHPDGVRLAAGTEGVSVGGADPPPEPVKVFDTTTGRQIIAELSPPATISGLRYTSDGKYLVEAGYGDHGGLGNSIRIWDSNHEKLLQQIGAEETYAMSLSRSGGLLAIAERERVSIWRIK